MLAFENGADTADTNQDLSALRNFSAFGGPINIISNTPMTPFGNRFADGGDLYNEYVHPSSTAAILAKTAL